MVNECAANKSKVLTKVLYINADLQWKLPLDSRPWRFVCTSKENVKYAFIKESLQCTTSHYGYTVTGSELKTINDLLFSLRI